MEASSHPDIRIRQKVGQMFMCGFTDTTPNDDILKLIKEYFIGGIIYFRRNIGTARQVYACSAALQQAAAEPLLIAVDQEGGMVARIEDDVTLMPGNMALGATRNVEGVRQAAVVVGRELRHLGINMNFAPCVDVNNNPANPVIGVRSYGESPVLVSEMGAAAADGFQQAGVAATIKHFPGHGDTDTDSHLALPSIGHGRERLAEIELLPFKRIIEAGVDAVMTAHVVFKAYEDEDIPATLSEKILTGLLREELAFDGVIVTDCLEMNAISQTVGVGPGAVQAVKAGADLILVSHTYDWQVEAIEAVVEAVVSGEIPETRIDASVQRLAGLKKKREITKEEPPAFADIKVKLASEASLEVARELSEQSITLLCDDGQLPLMEKEGIYVIWPEVRVSHEVVEALQESMTLGTALKPYFNNVRERIIGVDPSDEEIREVLEESQSFSQIVAATYNADFSPGQRMILQELAARTEGRLVVVAVRNPYDYTAVPGIRTYLASYENKALAMQSVAKILAGQSIARGVLPVTVGEFAYGSGSIH
ncbi:beta-N-acetylhexosaminidase [Paenibacillus sp. PK3_47]|uniref:beta-N-acetylhexosaminidase n=1 Tax=Paenibacillus sp. PK3_47 TaxID=2072642 RepID=UPI00201D93C3|nr:beta-N-acetylhexosaminidase [Paenibacillus sp. PK3_47]UQZ37096.1 beta-N-acetylhexosaminidase [Paenibacillus sp. PK3_47]